ncbi:hypothetical protein Cantr_04460 [Candida viswanathii]|uniref:INO80 complex subunit B-like conserved region domain-containing protein n=1 Tax=Candida viswanathii TaxID=5486 RepID=A0A367XQA0_9ASCO|nr:hypothetical protein Cantr_04460 [Candida viswanathii]
MVAPPKIVVDSEEEEDEYLDRDVDYDAESSVPPVNDIDNFDDEEEEEDELPDEEEDEEELPDDEEIEDDNYDFNDASDMDDDLELKDEDDESEKSKTPSVPPRKSIKITIKPPKKPTTPTATTATTTTPAAKSSLAQPSTQRTTRKRQVSYYAEDDDEDDDELEDDYAIAPSKQQPQVAKKLKKATSSRKGPERRNVPQQKYLDPDLVLTDEENEYNPSANTDISKMTERQRSRYANEDDYGTGEFIELDATGKKAKQTAVTQETEEEVALRKAENARKRQDYKNKMLEEEKRDTLNKLLKRRATKSREIINDDEKEGTDSLNSVLNKKRRPTLEHDAFVRYVSNTTNLNGNSVLAFK